MLLGRTPGAWTRVGVVTAKAAQIPQTVEARQVVAKEVGEVLHGSRTCVQWFLLSECRQIKRSLQA